jgi:hypothetical protein
MSLIRQASTERMWGSFPALRVILEKKRVLTRGVRLGLVGSERDSSERPDGWDLKRARPRALLQSPSRRLAERVDDEGAEEAIAVLLVPKPRIR